MSGALALPFLLLLALLLVPVVLIDLRERRIPNWSVLAIAALGLARAGLAAVGHPHAGTALHAATGGMLLALLNAGFAALLIAGTAWLLRLVSAAARVGMGDLKFLVAAAIWLGWDGSILVLGLASLLALLVALAEAPWHGLDLRRVRPFGPMLAGSMFALAALAIVLRGGP